MNDPDCTRWAHIVDEEALGAAITEADEGFKRAHEASCAMCAGEASQWRSLAARGELVDRGPDPARIAADLELVERVLASAKAESPPRARPRTWATAGVVGALALAAGVGLFLAHRTAPRAPVAVAPSARLLSTEGQVAIDGRPAAAGAEIPRRSTLRAVTGAACLGIGADVRVCVDPGSELTLHAIDGPAREIELVAGHVVIAVEHGPAHLPPEEGLSVVTRAGTVRDIGTVFAVDATDSARVTARVLAGEVSLSVPGEPDRRVAAHESMALGSAAPNPLSPADEGRERVLLAGASPAPSAMAAPAGSPSQALSEPLPAPTTPPAPAMAPQAPPSADAMLKNAVDLRAHGRIHESAEAFRALQAAHPRSAEARTALVSLGELQLGQLGDPAGALRSFDLYLAGSGPLSQDAAYARIRALHALGRTGEETRAIDAFLAAHPSSVYAQAARTRRAEIEGDAGP